MKENGVVERRNERTYVHGVNRVYWEGLLNRIIWSHLNLDECEVVMFQDKKATERLVVGLAAIRVAVTNTKGEILMVDPVVTAGMTLPDGYCIGADRLAEMVKESYEEK